MDKNQVFRSWSPMGNRSSSSDPKTLVSRFAGLTKSVLYRVNGN